MTLPRLDLILGHDALAREPPLPEQRVDAADLRRPTRHPLRTERGVAVRTEPRVTVRAKCVAAELHFSLNISSDLEQHCLEQCSGP